MKKIITIITIACAMTLSSCDGFLTQPPVSSLTNDLFWRTGDDVAAARAAMYASFATAMRQNFFNWGEIRGETFGVPTSLGLGQHQLMSDIISDVHNTCKWTDLYATVNKANLMIRHIPQMPSPDKTALAEAYAMRALAYFWLVRVWGDVPLYLDAVEEYDVNTCLKKRETKDVILAQIESDIAMAEDLFPKFNTSLSITSVSRVHMNLAATYALEVDVLAWQHRYDDVINVYENKISDLPATWFFFKQFSSVESGASDSNILKWRQIVMEEVTSSDREIFFAVRYDRAADATENYTRRFFCADGQFVTVNQKTIDAFQSGDIRFAGTFYSTGSSYRMEKFWEKGNAKEKDWPSDNDLIMYRYTDIMLLYVEALCERGRLTEAISLLNMVRSRAGLEEMDPESDQDAVAAETLYERHMELICEGKYWFDLVRTGNYLKEAGCPENRIYWPVHHDHLVQNPNLEQTKYEE